MQDRDQEVDATVKQSVATTTDAAGKRKPIRAASKHVKSAAQKAQQHARHHKRAVLLIAVPLVAVALLVWLAGNVYASRYKVGDKVTSMHMSDAMLAQAISGAAEQYTLRISEEDGATKTYSMQDIGLQPDVSATLASVKHQRNTWRHRLEWWQPVPVMLTTKVDMAALNKFIGQHITKTINPAHNATIEFRGDTVQLTAASAGKEYGLADPVATILAAAEQLQSAPLRLHTVAMQPAITKASLASVKTSLENILHQHIAIVVAGQTVTPKPSDIAGWLRLAPKPNADTVAISVDQSSVQSYVSTLAAAHEHPPRAQIVIPGGSTIQGERGVTIANQQSVAATIVKQLVAAKGIHATLPAQYTLYNTINAAVYSKWFDVDLTTHRMYAFQGTQLVRTFLISAGKYSTPTVTGDFAIYSKYTSQTMTGADYVQPNVPWVNYFYRDFAIHGNYWSPSSYFGSFNASHGCVGVPVGDAAWIYTWAPIGTHVEVHA